MLDHATQSTRELAVITPFGEDVLLLHRFRGREELSRLFEYELEMLSANDSLDPRVIIGKNISWVMNPKSSQPRFFNGHVSRFQYVDQNDHGTVYRATVVPWLWFLSKTRDCRIFQHQNVQDIVSRIFDDLGFTDYEWNLASDYRLREYCVQYRETDFDFVSRLLEEEGIFFHILHEAKKHHIVLSDTVSAYFKLPDYGISYFDRDQQLDDGQQITSWQHHYQFRPDQYSQTDYNFKTPNADLMSTENTVAEWTDPPKYEIYDYPGEFKDKSGSRDLTRIRMEELEWHHDTAKGKGTYHDFQPGGMFRFSVHRSSKEVGQKYVLTVVETSCSIGGTYDVHLGGSDPMESHFGNRFECIPAETIFRPERKTDRPVVEGPQTAIVVGPPGEEIYPDEFGRVKVQFHWDREAKRDENSSCWLRVSQVHAGQGWGGIDLPRIGEEVIVDFLEGNPDRPIITGRVYNAENMPPFSLPAEKTRSGMKTNTHKGSGSNEISMDDTAGAEQIRTNAQHNMDTTVGNNQTSIVGVDRTTDIGNNDALTVGNDQTEQVGNNKTVTVGNNMTVDVGSKLTMNAGSKITLKCGASKLTMNSGGVITLTGTIITTAAAANAAIAAPLTQVVGGVMLTTVGGVNMMNGGTCHVGAAALASVSGGKKVDVESSGVTAVKGGVITLN